MRHFLAGFLLLLLGSVSTPHRVDGQRPPERVRMALLAQLGGGNGCERFDKLSSVALGLGVDATVWIGSCRGRHGDLREAVAAELPDSTAFVLGSASSYDYFRRVVGPLQIDSLNAEFAAEFLLRAVGTWPDGGVRAAATQAEVARQPETVRITIRVSIDRRQSLCEVTVEPSGRLHFARCTN